MKLDKNAVGERIERKILPAGTYRARVESSIHKTFRSGNTGYEVQFSFPEEPDAKWVYEYFVENSEKLNQRKFLHFYASIGMDSDDTDDMNDIYGEEPLVELYIESDPTHGDKNRIKRFLPLPETDVEPEPEPAPKPAKKAKTGAKITIVKEEDLPF
jgi:hypothetical protein